MDCSYSVLDAKRLVDTFVGIGVWIRSVASLDRPEARVAHGYKAHVTEGIRVLFSAGFGGVMGWMCSVAYLGEDFPCQFLAMRSVYELMAFDAGGRDNVRALILCYVCSELCTSMMPAP